MLHIKQKGQPGALPVSDEDDWSWLHSSHHCAGHLESFCQQTPGTASASYTLQARGFVVCTGCACMHVHMTVPNCCHLPLSADIESASQENTVYEHCRQKWLAGIPACTCL